MVLNIAFLVSVSVLFSPSMCLDDFLFRCRCVGEELLTRLTVYSLCIFVILVVSHFDVEGICTSSRSLLTFYFLCNR